MYIQLTAEALVSDSGQRYLSVQIRLTGVEGRAAETLRIGLQPIMTSFHRTAEEILHPGQPR